MATTTNKSLVEPAFNNTTGTLPDGTPYTSWDSPLNYNETVTDNAFGGVVAVSTAGITTTQTLTLAQYQPLIINFSGALTVNLIYNFPTGVGGQWIIRNSCTGNFSLSVGSNGSTIVIPAGVSYYVYVDTSTAPYISFLNISGFRTNAGNPNGTVAGNSGNPASVIWDTTNSKLWVCTTTGIASAAVWTAGYQGIFADTNTWSGQNNFSSATGAIGLTAGPIAAPGGRLTLASNTPVLQYDTTANVIYYTPYLNNFASLYDGTAWTTWGFSQLSQALNDTTKSPAASSGNSGYDVFLWNDAGTLRATRGPAWTSVAVGSANRGTGAGTTQLVRVNGTWMNANSITNGPAAQRGVYLGSFQTNASNSVDWVTNPSAASGGGNARIGLWNMFNRILAQAISIDNSSPYTYSGAIHSANNSTSNRVTIFVGLNEDGASAFGSTCVNYNGSVTSNTFTGIGLNTTSSSTSPAGHFGQYSALNNISQISSTLNSRVVLGSNFFQLVESCDNTSSTTLNANSNQNIQLLTRM